MSRKDAFIITNPMIAANKSAEVTLSKFIRVISPAFENISVIGGNLSVEEDLNRVTLHSYPIVRSGNKIKRALEIVGLQFKMTKKTAKYGNKNTPTYFWIADKMILPFFVAKFKGAEINYFIYGNVSKEGTANKFTLLSSKLIRYMASHADYICMESKSVLNEWPGLKYKKIKIIHLYTNSIVMNSINEREKIFGMVCRLTSGKHVLECIQAMKKVHEKHPDWKLEIIGSGKQQQECENLVAKLKADQYIKLLGWVEHNVVTQKAEKWRYLLFPTDTEGMPNGLIEMMGCGIPALASQVGGVADVVRDQENGFKLTKCTTDVLEQTMLDALSIKREQYEIMAYKAYEEIKLNFTLKAAQDVATNYL